VDKDDFIPEIDELPKDISKKLKVDLKDVLAFDSRNATGRYSFDLERFADRIIIKKLIVCFSSQLFFSAVSYSLKPGSERQGEDFSETTSIG
jgi:hypothetical protein